MAMHYNSTAITSSESLTDGKARRSPTGRPAVAGMTEETWKRLAFEAEVLDHVLKTKRTRASVTLAGTVLGWSTSKTYRILKRYREAGHILALTRTSAARGTGSRLTPEQDELIDKELRKFLKSGTEKRVSKFVAATLDAFKKAGLKLPSARSIRRRFERLSERQRYAHKYGARAAADKFDIERGSTPPTHFPLERIQLDHTSADIWLMSEDYSLSLGRPTITLVIDEFSRIVLGIHVTFSYPSVDELAEAMAIACLPKDGWLRAMGIENVDWPWHGIPSKIFVDRGVDFTSTAFFRGCQKWRIALSHRAQPHHGGIIERLIGTAMQETRNLPGNTRFSKAQRKEDRVDPAKTAKLNLSDYLARLVHYFVVAYPHRIHSALGMTPAEKWNLGVHEFGDPRRIDDSQSFYLDFLKAKPRMLEKYGVMVSYLKYRHRRLQPLIDNRSKIEVLVKRDPADVSRAFVDDPKDGGYIELTNELTAGKGIGVAEWERARLELKALLKGEKVTATGILGFIEKSRRSCSPILSPTQQTSKLNRAKTRKAEHARNRRTRSKLRLPEPVEAQKPALPELAVDLNAIPLFQTSGDVL